jgi:hypothetical protein
MFSYHTRSSAEIGGWLCQVSSETIFSKPAGCFGKSWQVPCQWNPTAEHMQVSKCQDHVHGRLAGDVTPHGAAAKFLGPDPTSR